MYSLVLMAALSGSAATPAYGCWGCYGCGGCYGCWGGYGCGCYGYRVSYGCWGGCWGCYGGGYHGCWGGCWNGRVVPAKPAQPQPGPQPGPETRPPAGGGARPPEAGTPTQPEVRPIVGEQAMMGKARAYLVVNLPSEAKLSVDDQATTSTASPRMFVTPALPRGRDFLYILKAEIVRDGTPVTTTKQVTVRAGQTTHVTLEFPASVAQK